MATGVYSKTMTMADDLPTRFETSKKVLKSAYIQVATQDMKLGGIAGQNYTQTTTATPIVLNDLDISKLYFKNKTAGQNGVINIIGTVL